MNYIIYNDKIYLVNKFLYDIKSVLINKTKVVNIQDLKLIVNDPFDLSYHDYLCKKYNKHIDIIYMTTEHIIQNLIS